MYQSEYIGAASGLRNSVCSIRPATPNDAPQNSAINARGKRNSSRILCQAGLFVSPPVRIAAIACNGMLTAPQLNSPNRHIRRASVTKARRNPRAGLRVPEKESVCEAFMVM